MDNNQISRIDRYTYIVLTKDLNYKAKFHGARSLKGYEG